MPYPLMFRLKQSFRRSTIEDVPSAVKAELAKLCLHQKLHPGDSVAVAFGCRMIANYPAILKAIVEHFKQLQAHPFLVPAMGIHGGGTVESQFEALRMFGITAQTVGAEIRLSFDAEVIGHMPQGVPVYCDRRVLEADHLFVVNRVRPHSAFSGEVQSGLLKMLATDLGKRPGVQVYHQAIATIPFVDLARGIWRVMLDKARLLGGLMLVDNGNSGTALIQGALAEEFADAEPTVLTYAQSLFPRLPFRFIDILMIDEMGSAFGSHGVDLNIVGRKQSIRETTSESAHVRTLVFRDLHPAAMGNATGISHADLVRSRLIKKMDATATDENALALTMPSLASIPMHFETDREILDAALKMNCLQPPDKARIVWIRNTSSLAELECSEPFLEEVMHWKELSVASELHPLDFDSDGNLRDFVIGSANPPDTFIQPSGNAHF